MAQWKSVPFTPERSLVRTQLGPPQLLFSPARVSSRPVDRTSSNDGGAPASPGQSPEIFSAELQDAPDLSSLAALTFPLACPPDLSREDIASFIEANLTPSAFRAYLSNEDNIVLMARDGQGDPLAYVLALPGRGDDEDAAALITGARPLYLSKVYAAPRAQGTGLSSALVSSLIDEARSRGFDSMWLGTNVDNARARRFYDKTGFVDRGRRTFVVGGQICHDVVYELPL